MRAGHDVAGGAGAGVVAAGGAHLRLPDAGGADAGGERAEDDLVRLDEHDDRRGGAAHAVELVRPEHLGVDDEERAVAARQPGGVRGAGHADDLDALGAQDLRDRAGALGPGAAGVEVAARAAAGGEGDRERGQEDRERDADHPAGARPAARQPGADGLGDRWGGRDQGHGTRRRPAGRP